MRLGFFYWGVLYADGEGFTCDDVQANAASALAARLGPVDMVAQVDCSGRRRASEVLDTDGLTIHPLPHCAGGRELHLTRALPLAAAVRRVVADNRRRWDGVVLWECPQPNQWAYVFNRLYRVPMIMFLAGRPGKAFMEAYRDDFTPGGRARRQYGRFLNWFTGRLTRRLPTMADVDLGRIHPDDDLNWAFYSFGRWRAADLPGGEPKTPVDRGDLSIFTASRISPVKGIEHLIEAAGILRDRGVPVKVRIAGEAYDGMYGGYSDKLRGQIAGLNLEGVVDFVGRLDKPGMMDAYSSSHVLAMPATSNAEGVPKIIPEALAMGLPVVSTDVGSVFHVVRPGKNGLLVEPRSASALADAFARLAGDGDLYSRLSRGALASAPVYTLDHQADLMADFIRRGLKRK